MFHGSPSWLYYGKRILESWKEFEKTAGLLPSDGVGDHGIRVIRAIPESIGSSIGKDSVGVFLVAKMWLLHDSNTKQNKQTTLLIGLL